MYHSLYFVTEESLEQASVLSLDPAVSTVKNTWTDWYLIPKKRPSVAAPEQKTNTIDVQGANGLIDLSRYLTGRPLYNNRTGTWNFLVHNDHKDTWATIYSDILAFLHGQTRIVVLEDDPMYYYIGRFTVSDWDSQPHNSELTIAYDLYPFKKRRDTTFSDWIWDDFNFESGEIINEIGNTVILHGSEIKTVYITGDMVGNEPIVPSIELDYSNGINVTFLNLTTQSSVSVDISDSGLIELDQRFEMTEDCNYAFAFKNLTETVTPTDEDGLPIDGDPVESYSEVSLLFRPGKL